MSDNEREYQEALALHLEIADVSMKVTVKALFMSFSDEGMAALIKMLQEYGRPTVPGHGLYKPREADPELIEVTCTQKHISTTQIPHKHVKKVGREVQPGLAPLFEVGEGLSESHLPEGDEKYIEHEYGS